MFFSMLGRHYFKPQVTLAEAIGFKWLPMTGTLPERLEGLESEDAAKEAGYWRDPDLCMAHRKGEGHFCWERSTIEDLFREMKKDPKDLKSKSL